LKNRLLLKIGYKQEFAGIVGLLFMLVLVTYIWPVPAMRIVLGLLYVLFLPGYALVTALFPRRHDLDSITRTALSFGLNIAIVTFIGLLLHYTGWGIQLDPILVSTNSFVLLCSGAAYCRRSGLLPEERFVVRVEFDLSSWRDKGWSDRLLSMALALSITAAIGSLVYGIAKPEVGERFTDFYILGPDGGARGYAEETVAGKPLTVIVGIVNREQSDIQYRVEVERDGGKEQIASPRLSHEETWEQTYVFVLNETGQDRRVTFLLYKGNSQEVCRSLHLWITVKEEASQ
jgi:uncharacterized membrane protein